MPMLEPIKLLFEQAPIFALVLFRVGGMMVFAPLMGSASVPGKVKMLITLMLSMAVFPQVSLMGTAPNNMFGLAVAVGNEVLIGISMGFTLTLMYTGVQMGAELVSQQMGWSLAQLVDPVSQISTTVLSQFFVLLTTLIYVLMNGHLILIQSLLETFETIPLMGSGNAGGVLELFLATISAAFALGIRLAGPALAAIFLATMALGFISRTMPQLNILAAGFPVRITLSLMILIASLGSACVLLEDQLSAVLRGIGTMFI
jgi:flagellar biosynthetic protein FliR